MQYDGITGANVMISYEHHEVHEGGHYHLAYSVANIGAATSPDDMMTLSFTTPNTTKLLHMIFVATSASGGVFKFIEGKTSGGATPTGTIQSYNSNRASSNTSGILDVAGANATKVSYDATAFVGGIELVSEVIGAKGQGNTFSGGSTRVHRNGY